jgi:hypothetical protein
MIHSRDRQLRFTRGQIFRKLKSSGPENGKKRSFKILILISIYIHGNNKFNTHDSTTRMIRRN